MSLIRTREASAAWWRYCFTRKRKSGANDAQDDCLPSPPTALPTSLAPVAIGCIDLPSARSARSGEWVRAGQVQRVRAATRSANPLGWADQLAGFEVRDRERALLRRAAEHALRLLQPREQRFVAEALPGLARIPERDHDPLVAGLARRVNQLPLR